MQATTEQDKTDTKELIAALIDLLDQASEHCDYVGEFLVDQLDDDPAAKMARLIDHLDQRLQRDMATIRKAAGELR